MSIDGRFIEKLAQEIDSKTRNTRINKISQLSRFDFLFGLSTKESLYLSLSTSLARVHLVAEKYNNLVNPGGFCMFLRKYLEKGIILGVTSLNNDRIIELRISNRNEIGDLTEYFMIIEIFGRYANLIILDNQRTIINAFKHIHPFEGADRTIYNGIKYTLPDDNRINPRDFENVKNLLKKADITQQDLVSNIKGISPLFAKAVVEKANYQPHRMFEVYYEFMNMSVNPTKANNKFYFIDLFKSDQIYFSTLSEMLEKHFHDESSLERVKQVHKQLTTFIKNNLEKDLHKLEKLKKDLNEAENNQINRIKGDLLLQNNNLIDRNKSEVKLYSYELEKEVTIEIDQMACPIDNANKYFNRYKKQKSAIKFIENQMELTKKEVSYFRDLLEQVNSNHNLKDLEEIQEELINNRYLPKKKSKGKSRVPNYDIYYDELGFQIVVGKNNLQNNYVTHKLAKKDYMWFHVQNQTGSHVVVMTGDNLDEVTIRAAANLAAFNSKSKNSSSVPIDYTKVKHIKKIPGEFGSFVSYTNQKTIFIDPDQEQIKKLRKG